MYIIKRLRCWLFRRHPVTRISDSQWKCDVCGIIATERPDRSLPEIEKYIAAKKAELGMS